MSQPGLYAEIPSSFPSLRGQLCECSWLWPQPRWSGTALKSHTRLAASLLVGNMLSLRNVLEDGTEMVVTKTPAIASGPGTVRPR